MEQQENTWLLEKRRNDTSSHGEDGIIEAIFEVIGGGAWCVELGALNGTHDSNVWTLIQKKNWSGVLLEADATYFEKLKKAYAGNPRAHCIQSFVSFAGDSSLDMLLAQTPIPKTFDLFSLDVDGNEYHLWDSMEAYRPRVMVVEFNPSIPNSVSFVQPKDMSVYQGSSLRALVGLGQRKGYELVAANELNAFFVLRELFPLFNIADNSIEVLHTDTQFQTMLYQLYDGTLKIAGNTHLIWHQLPIAEELLQVLPKAKRAYPARISTSGLMRSIKYYVRKLPVYSILQRIRRQF